MRPDASPILALSDTIATSASAGANIAFLLVVLGVPLLLAVATLLVLRRRR